MSLDVKICGLSTPDTLDAAVGAGASHVGFVIFPRSPRHLDFARGAGLRARVPARVASVVLLVDPDDTLVDQAVRALRPDIVQLHGRETPERCLDVRRRWNVGVWKAQGVRTSADVQAAGRYAGTVDLLLFDAKPPTPPPGETALPGGTGVRFDWRLLDGLRLPMRWGLAGGLDADTVGEAVRLTRPALVDVSSGVEEAPGVKSVAKIQAFMAAARAV